MEALTWPDAESMMAISELPSRADIGSPARVDPVALATELAQRVAGPASDSVDRDSRFPFEAIEALRDASLMTALVPERFGGLGCTIAQVAAICEALGQQCASAA